MPWEKTYSEPEVLERAMRAFWARGYSATSVGDLVAATGLGRGSLYAAFTDKRGLFRRALAQYDATHRIAFLDELTRSHPPRDAILAAFAAAAANTGAGDTPAGCLLVNTALELSPHDPEIAAFVASAFAAVEAFFLDRITEAQADDSIPAALDADATAKALLGLFVGLRVLTRGAPAPAALSAITAQAEAMLG